MADVSSAATQGSDVLKIIGGPLIGGIGTLIGVLVGWWLSEGTRRKREKEKFKKTKEVIYETIRQTYEIHINIWDKTIKDLRNDLNSGSYTKVDRSSPTSIVYPELFSDIYVKLSEDERDALWEILEGLQLLEKNLNSYPSFPDPQLLAVCGANNTSLIIKHGCEKQLTFMENHLKRIKSAIEKTLAG